MASTSAAYDRRPEEAFEAASGEQFDALYRRYHPRLVAMCKRRVEQDALAEDIAQETLVRAFTHLDAFDDRRPLWPWLKTIATNLIVDHFRKHAREVYSLSDEPHMTEDGPSIEEADLLRRAIRMLPRRQRAAVALRYVNDWDAHDAANFMGLTRPAYEQLLFRARRRLKAEYRRLAQEVSAGLVLGSSGIRSLLRRISHRAREAGAGVPSLGELASVSATHFVSGAVVLAMSLGQATPAEPPAEMAAGRAGGPHAVSAFEPSKEATSSKVVHASGDRSLQTASAGGGGETPADQAPAQDGDVSQRSLLDRMTAEDVEQPEDAHITSVVMSPRVAEDGTMLAAGRGDCPHTACPASVFISRDAGHTWSGLPATGFDGETLMLPPAFGDRDDRIFAMGRAGLQVSADGGTTFTPAAPTGANYVVGAAAMSPGFNDGDPSILIGAQTLMRYRDDTRVVEPVPWGTGAGPLYPTFSPQYPADDRVLVGGLHPAPDGQLSSAVHVCSSTACSATLLGRLTIHPKVRVAPDFSSSNLAFAFTDETIFRSTDGGASFEKAASGWDGGYVYDVAVSPAGRVFAAIYSRGTTGGLYYSDDRGATWQRVDNPLFEHGAMGVIVAGGRVVASLGTTGIACSSDDGTTWAERCGS